MKVTSPVDFGKKYPLGVKADCPVGEEFQTHSRAVSGLAEFGPAGQRLQKKLLIAADMQLSHNSPTWYSLGNHQPVFSLGTVSFLLFFLKIWMSLAVVDSHS